MISAAEIWFFAIGAFLLPVVLIVVWKIRTGAKMAPFWCGMIVFFVFAMILEQVSHYVFLVMPWAGSEYIKNHTLAYAVYGCLAAGIFEETGRFFAFSIPLKKHRERTACVTYGLGHGGCEAMLIAGMPAISYLVLYYNPALDTTSAISTIVPGTLALGILERLLAIVIHVSLSVIVFTAVTTGRKYLYPVAIVLHALVDVPAVLYQRQVISGLATVEILTAAESAILAIIAYKMYKKLPEA